MELDLCFLLKHKGLPSGQVFFNEKGYELVPVKNNGTRLQKVAKSAYETVLKSYTRFKVAFMLHYDYERNKSYCLQKKHS